MPKILTLLSGILCWLVTFSQPAFNIEQYTSHTGLPQNSISSMEFDSSGYLWLSTEGGIVKFDGSSMRTFNTTTNPEFIFDRGNRILKTFQGEVVVYNGTSGPYVYQSGRLRRLHSQISSDRWVTWVKGAIPSIEIYERLVKEKVLRTQFSETNRNFVSMYPINDSMFIVAGWGDPLLFHQSAFQKKLTTYPYYPVSYLMINGHLLFFDDQHRLFRIDVPQGTITLCSITGETWNTAPHYELFFEEVYHSTWPFSHSFVIEGTSLYKLSAGKDQDHYTSELITRNLPENCQITCISDDADRNLIAIGTDSKGLFIYRENSLKTVQHHAPDENNSNVYYVQLPLDSTKVLTNFQRVFDTRTGLSQKSEIGPFDGFCLLRDKSDNIWYSNSAAFVRYQRTSGQIKAIPKKIGVEANVLFESVDRIWIGAQSGLSFIKDDSVTLLPPYSGDPTYSFCEIPGKGLMTATQNGVYFLNTSTYDREPIPALDEICVRALQRIGDFVFLGTYGNGFYMWKEDKLVKAPLDRYKGLMFVHTFFEDVNGFVWMTTNKGLFKTTFNSLQTYFSDSTTEVYYYRYGIKDGIINDEFNGGCSPAHAQLANGYVSLPTMQGLVWLQPEMAASYLPVEGITIDFVEIDEKEFPSVNTLNLHCDYRTAEVFFSSPYWGNEENIWMDYKIEGDQNKWIPIDLRDRRIMFSKLSAGKYNLIIRKRSGFGKGDWVQANLPIIIEPYFYQTGWFYLLVILLGSGSFWLLATWYTASIRMRNQRLESLVRERTVELQLANEHLAISERDLKQSVTVKDKLISILSHDIITPLRFIGLTARMAKNQNHTAPDSFRKTLGDIQSATVKLHDNASNILNWINLQNKRIEVQPSNVALFALVDELFDKFSEMADLRGTQLVNQVSEDLILHTDAQLLNIVLYNIVSNSIKHTRQGTINVSAVDEMTRCIITITDNGDGIPELLLERINSPSADQLVKSAYAENDFGGSGLGYLVIKDLLPTIRGSYVVSSRHGMGTTVVFIFEPLVSATP